MKLSNASYVLATAAATTLLADSVKAQLSVHVKHGRPRRLGQTPDIPQALADNVIPQSLSLSLPSTEFLDGETGSSVMPSRLSSSKSGKTSKSGKISKSGEINTEADRDPRCRPHNNYPTLDRSQAFQPLIQPSQVYPDADGITRHDMIYDLVHYKGPSFNVILRLFNGAGPGPTMHILPGGEMKMELVNCMYPEPYGFDGEEAHNKYHAPNTTNIHTHGPHISAMHPGDDIFVKVDPNTTHLYEYVFDENHMPGTFWYHPHFHGSTALQVGQGAAGALIMDEPKDYPMPSVYKDMPEIQLVFQHMNLDDLRSSSETSEDNVTDWDSRNFEITNATTDLTNFMLVNMQYIPVVKAVVGKWTKLRMVMSSIGDSVAFESQTGNCEFALLAKDGIFINDAPRDVPVIILSPGNRADVVMRCHKPGQDFMNTTLVTTTGGYGNFDPTDQFDQIMDENEYDFTVEMLAGSFTDPEAQPTIFVVDAVAPALNESGPPGEPGPGPPLVPFTPPMPCYLVDLRSLDDSDMNTIWNNRYFIGAINGLFPFFGIYGPFGKGGVQTEENKMPWVDRYTFVNEFDTGTVNQIVLEGAADHPYHQHVNSFQIIKIEPEDLEENLTLFDSVATWYQEGDWHDVLQLPSDVAAKVTVRFQADQFTGNMVQHCHILSHEDQGMMAQYEVTGEEWAIWPGAREIEPLCMLPSQKTMGGSKYGLTLPVVTARPTIAEFLTDYGKSFQTLVELLVAENLLDVLDGDGPFTLYAPTDSAFDRYFLPEDSDLTDLLLYHVSPEYVVAEPGEDSQSEVATLLSDAYVVITTTMSSAAVSVNGVTALATVEASNGRVFVMGEVLFPPNVDTRK